MVCTENFYSLSSQMYTQRRFSLSVLKNVAWRIVSDKIQRNKEGLVCSVI